jgi:hypothetical protein
MNQHLNRRTLFKWLSILGLKPSSLGATSNHVLTPEMFGAKGDGRTNDSEAFSALSDAINRNSGGTIRLRKTVYMVAKQRRPTTQAEGWALEPLPLLHIVGCRDDVVIDGNGACLRSAPGLRFGTFDRGSLQIRRRTMPNFRAEERATPYSYMVLVERCSGAITISDLELDGSVRSHVIGGPYGDTGWQIPATGLFLRDNSGPELLKNIHSHHHAQDGVIIDGLDSAEATTPRREIVDVRCRYNGRQGLSIVGGKGYRFTSCHFEHTGRAGVSSQPGAGVDIEAEGGKKIRNLSFVECVFNNNFGCGVIADSGDSANVTFELCTFRGTTAWSAWPAKPSFVFRNCTFQGAVVRTFASEEPQLATHFIGCTFVDHDPKLPGAQLYLGDGKSGPIVNANIGQNVLFMRCVFRLRRRGTLPWSMQARYDDCVMHQASPDPAYPRGQYNGRTIINGPAVVQPSKIMGTLILNGKLIDSGQQK